MRSVKRFLSSMINMVGVLASAVAYTAVVLGPPVVVIYIIAHFIIKFW